MRAALIVSVVALVSLATPAREDPSIAIDFVQHVGVDPLRPREIPERLDTRRRKPSERGLFQVGIRPATRELAINRVHAWTVQIRWAEGAALKEARLEFDGGMPAHNHGFPTAPRVVGPAGTGTWLVDGIKFNMTGWWRFEIGIHVGDVEDHVVFDLVVRDAPWSDEALRELRSLWIGALGDPPPDPSNRFADDLPAAELGHRLFFDTALSGNGEIACSSCHRPERAFTDGLARAEAIGTSRRGTPTLLGVAWSPWQYWDGRRDSLWAQALSPIETPEEMGSTRTDVVRRLACDADYRQAYEAIFDPLPSCARMQELPDRATPRVPGAPRRRWQAIPEAERAAIDRAFVAVGKALAAYQRKLVPGASRFDAYVEALLERTSGEEILSEREIAGLRLFVEPQAQCLRCHNGPLFSNHGFHNIGLPRVADRPADAGRIAAIEEVLADPFNCLGEFSDAEPEACVELNFAKQQGEELPGAFKVPTLRNVAQTAPYMHTGQLPSLRSVLEHYAEPGTGTSGHQELVPLQFTEEELAALEAFLGTLSAPPATDARWLQPPQSK